MVEFEVKIVVKFQNFFDVSYAKIDSTTTTLNRGNAIQIRKSAQSVTQGILYQQYINRSLYTKITVNINDVYIFLFKKRILVNR
jgi:hypothetical protein